MRPGESAVKHKKPTYCIAKSDAVACTPWCGSGRLAVRVPEGQQGSVLSVHVGRRSTSSRRVWSAPAHNPVSPGRRPGTVSHQAARTDGRRSPRLSGCARNCQDLSPHIISRPARRFRCRVECFDRSLEWHFETRVGTACRQRVRPDQARLERGFRFCEPIADRTPVVLRLRMRHALWFRKNDKAWSACAHARSSLETTLSTVRSVSMTKVVRLTGISRPSRPRRRVCLRRRALRAGDRFTQLGEPASAHPEQLGHHAVRSESSG